MKTSLKIFGIMLLLAIGSGGCASAPKSIDPNYQAYQQAMITQKPLVEIAWSADGQRMTSLKVNPQMSIQQKQPDAPHPAWSVANSLIRVGGIVGGIWAGGQALEGVIEAGNGATSIANSYNQPGGSMAGADMSIPTTTTTTTTSTETMTGIEPSPTE